MAWVESFECVIPKLSQYGRHFKAPVESSRGGENRFPYYLKKFKFLPIVSKKLHFNIFNIKIIAGLTC